MSLAPANPCTRFWPLFAIACLVRVVVTAVGLALAATPPDLRPPNDPVADHLRDEILASSARPIEPWFRWDAGWYVAIAESGYAHAANKSGLLGVAFLPALPLCEALADTVGVNPFWAALVIVNLAGAAGTVFFARLAARLTGDRAVGLRAFALMQAYPASLFLSAPYNESFGLLFGSLALNAWLSQRSVRASAFAGLCSLSRLTGVALGVAAIGGWICDDRTRSGLKRALMLAMGSLLALLLFWCYLGWVVHDPFAGLKAQEAWGRKELSVWNPLHSFQTIITNEKPRRAEAFEGLGFSVEAATSLIFVVLGVRSWIKRGAFWGLVTLVPIGQLVMSGSFLSAHRLLLAALPGFVELADLLRNRLLFWVILTGFVCVQFVLLNRYVHWRFAG
jgi:hypothetical protein